MTDVVGGIAITIDADIGPLVSQMDRAKAAIGGLRGVTDRTAAALRGFSDRASAAGRSMSMVTAGVTAAVTGMALMAKNAAGTADAIGDASAAAGVSTKFFQDMGFAMGVAADMTQEEFGAALVRLNRTLGEAQQGSAGAIAAFEAIGVSQAEIASGAVTTEEAFDAYIQKMGEVESPALAAALSTDLFGKAGAAMGGQLAGASGAVADLVARADELGIAIGQDAIDAAGKFDTSWRELTASAEALKVKIGTELLPVIVDRLIPALIDHVIPAIGNVVAKLADLGTAFAGMDPAVQTTVLAITGAFAVGGPVLLAIGAVSAAVSALFLGPAAPLIGLAAAIAGLSAAWPAFGEAAHAAFVVLGGSVVGAIKLLDQLLTTLGKLPEGIGIGGQLSTEDAIKRDGTARLRNDMGPAGFYINPYGAGGNTNLGGGNGTDTGAMMVNGMVNGIAMQMEARRGDIEAAAAVAEQIFRDKMEIQSPSQVFFRMGEFIGQGLSDGIASTSAMVGAAVDGMAGSAVDSTNAMASDILKGMDTLFGQSKSVGAAIALVNTLIGASQEIKKGVFGFASMAAVLARGYALVSAIKGAGKGGSGGSVAAGSAPAERPLAVNLNTFGDGDFIRKSDLGDTLDRLNEIAGDRGYTILSVPQ